MTTTPWLRLSGRHDNIAPVLGQSVRRTWLVLGVALLGAGCSAQVSDPEDLGPRRSACAPQGACRPCPCPGFEVSGYQLCDSRGAFVNVNGQPGCTCPPPPRSEIPAACGGVASSGAGGGF